MDPLLSFFGHAAELQPAPAPPAPPAPPTPPASHPAAPGIAVVLASDDDVAVVVAAAAVAASFCCAWPGILRTGNSDMFGNAAAPPLGHPSPLPFEETQ